MRKILAIAHVVAVACVTAMARVIESPLSEPEVRAAHSVARAEGRVLALEDELRGYENRVAQAKAAGDKDRASLYDGRAGQVKEQLKQSQRDLKDARAAAGTAAAKRGQVIAEGAQIAAGLDPRAPRRSDQTPQELATQRAGVPPEGSDTFETYQGSGPPETGTLPVGATGTDSEDAQPGEERKDPPPARETTSVEPKAERTVQPPATERGRKAKARKG